jgi:bromodomain-containing factor 1
LSHCTRAHQYSRVAHKYDALFDDPEPLVLDPSIAPAQPTHEAPAAINGNGTYGADENQSLPEDLSAPIVDVSSGITPVIQFIPETATEKSITTAVEAPTSDLRRDTESVPTGGELEMDIAATNAVEPQPTEETANELQATEEMDISQDVTQEIPREVSQDASHETSSAPLASITQETEMDMSTASFAAPATEVLEPSGDITTLTTGTHSAIQDQLKVDTQPEAPISQTPLTESPITADQEMADAPSAGKVRSREDDDEEAPSAKRTKTDEETETSTEFKVPEVPTPRDTQAVDGAQTNASQPAIQTACNAQAWPAGPMTKAQNKFLLERVRNTKKIKVAFAFISPVDPVALNIPTYPEMIKHPISLVEMEQMLKEDKYSTIMEFMQDLDLLVDNSITFNSMSHPISQAGLNMRAYFLKGMGKMPLEDVQPPVQKKPKKPTVATSSKPRREPRTSAAPTASPVLATPTAASPQNAWPLKEDGTPMIRRDSSNANDRPKREIHRPPPKDLPYNSVKPKKKKYQLELKFCESVLSELTKTKYRGISVPFLQPVDPVALNIPNYLRIIKKPMDLATIEKNLKSGLYQTSKDFHSDVKLVFDNCFKFNPPEDGVHKMGKAFLDVFNGMWADKDRWLVENGSQPASPADSEESEDEDEVDPETAQLMALQQQMAQLNEQAQRLIQQKAGKRASPKAPNKKGSKISAKAAPKRKSSTIVPPPKASKPRRQEREPAPLTFAQKQEISDGISTLGDVDMRRAVQIIRNGVPHLAVSKCPVWITHRVC